MDSLYLYILGFGACAGLIIFSGARLAKYGEIIVELSGMSKAWFGLILMAFVTTLPELFSGFSSIVIVDSPDIAVGGIMGSCAFNLLILAVLDYFIPGKPLSSVVTKSHLLSGLFSIILISLAVIAILFEHRFPMIGVFRGSAFVIILLYLIAVRVIFKSEKRNNQDKEAPAEGSSYKGITKGFAIRQYVLFAILVIMGALALPFFADSLAEVSGISKSFVGTLLVAAATSLPELVVTISAVRMGNADIAVGNLLGSNIFNMLILALCALMYTKGSLLASISPNHALSGMVTLIMTAVAGIGILYSSASKRFILGLDAIILIILYTWLILALYSMG